MPRLRTLTDDWTVVPAGKSGVSGGGEHVEHHRTSVLSGFTINWFEVIHIVISSIQADTRLVHSALQYDHDDKTDTSGHHQHKSDRRVHAFPESWQHQQYTQH